MLMPKKIILPSIAYSSGHANISCHNFGEGIIVDGGNKKSDLTWEFNCNKPGKYFLITSYASNEIRGVSLFLNEQLLKNDATMELTGGWTPHDVKDFLECECILKKGINYLNLKTNNFIPHLREFKFIYKKSSRQNPLKETLIEKTVNKVKINPYTNPNPAILIKFLNSLVFKGLRETLKKSIKHLSPLNYCQNNYAEILGIFTKKLAFKGPNLVQIDITNQCNNNCIGCWCNSPLLEEKAMPSHQKQKHIPYNRLIRLFHELKAIGVKELYFSGGGEPFMHPDIIDILRQAKKLNFTTYVNTNFTLLNRKKIEQIVEAGVDHLTVSVWAGTGKVYTETHPNKTDIDFLKLKNNLIYLNSIKSTTPYTKVYHVISQINYHDFLNMFTFALNTLSDSVEFTLIDIIPNKTDKLLLKSDHLSLLRAEALALQEKCLKEPALKEKITLFGYDDFLRRIESSMDVESGIYDRNIVSRLPCTIGWTFARINANGDVNGCLKSHKLPVGNIFDNSFRKIWISKNQENFRKHTIEMKKNDPFFQKIGNDESCREGCIKVCDDIGRNLNTLKKIESLSHITKLLLKTISYFYLKGYVTPGIYKNIHSPKRISNQNLGFIDGKKAFTGPSQVVIDLTNKCTRNCLPCFTHSPLLIQSRPSIEWYKKSLKLDELKGLIYDLKDLGTHKVRFSGGGDPLCYPQIIETIKIAKNAGLYVALTSSLPEAGHNTLLQAIKTGLDELSISLMSSSSKTYETLHPNSKKDEFSSLIKIIKEVSKIKKLKTTLCFVISKVNFLDLKEIIKLSHDLNIPSVYFTLIDDTHPELKAIGLKPADCNKLIDTINDFENNRIQTSVRMDNIVQFKSHIKNKLKINDIPIHTNVNNIPCSAGWHFSRILASGDVIPCCKATSWPVGNIKSSPFKTIWNGALYSEFRYQSKNISEFTNKFKRFDCLNSCDNLAHNLNFYRENISPYEN